jgi:cobyrinic acid a,c-diamide synthase
MKKPAFIIGAARSGGGKTTITTGILAALVRKGYRVQPFKCGPDFIDPTLHSWVTGTTSYNLDIKMMGETCCREVFHKQAASADIIVVEGVMGLFDGGEASTAELAKLLDLPVILIVDAQSSAESNVAVLSGFEHFDPEVKVCGVIFNRIGSERHRELIEDAVQSRSRAEVLGYLPREADFEIPQRHLGLHMGEERPIDRDGLEKLVASIEHYLDLDRLLQISSNRIIQPPATLEKAWEPKGRKRIGFARDEAFCFFYEQNLELLELAGFDIIPFSPIHDRLPPENLDLLYFCGGYPEIHASRLADNHSMRQAVSRYHRRGTPLYGECGGFMYLCTSLMDGREEHDMVGVFPLHTAMNKRLRRLGYRVVTLTEDCLFGRRGATLHGHEFHYSDIVRHNGSTHKSCDLKNLYLLDNNSHEGYSVGAAIGSYIHLHFGQSRDVLEFMFNNLK